MSDIGINFTSCANIFRISCRCVNQNNQLQTLPIFYLLKLTFTFLRPLSTAIIFAAVFLCNFIEAWAQSTGFLENKGQVVDQNGNRRDDILYLFEQDGFTLALGRDFFIPVMCSGTYFCFRTSIR